MLKFPWPARKKADSMQPVAAEAKPPLNSPQDGLDGATNEGFHARAARMISNATRLALEPHDEAAPYKHLYAAADELLLCQKEAESRLASATETAEDAALPAFIAELSVRRGLYLTKTDLLSDGEAALVAGLPAIEAGLPDRALLLLRAYNALALLHAERDEPQRALERLEAAEAVFRSHLAVQAAPDVSASPPAASQPGAPAAAGAASGGAAVQTAPGEGPRATGERREDAEAGEGAASSDGGTVPASAAEQAHTLTLFYLAQVLSHFCPTSFLARVGTCSNCTNVSSCPFEQSMPGSR